MNRLSNWRRVFTLAVVLVVGFAGAATAQLQTGNLYGNVTDNEGAALPGVTVTLTGIGAPRVQVTSAEGEFRFLGLNPGNYQVVAELDGFSTVEYPNVNIRVGASVTLDVTMTPAIEDTITVTSESPLLDERSISRGTTVTEIELEKIPTARDPWALLNQASGVLTDRINVGGNESGQQTVFVGTGATSSQNQFAVDGVNITDMSAVGSSPTYYDFGSFEEVQLTTGGSDVTKMASGVSVNVVTKRGTNEWRGSGRYFLTDGDWQSDPGLDASDFPAGQIASLGGDVDNFQANEIVEITDFGGELGGPIVRDRLWIWGSYGENEIQNLVAGGARDDTLLENYAGKLNAQIAAPNSAVAQYTYGDKQKTGRGAGPSREQPTSWNQTGPTDIYKIEDTHVFGSNFYLTGLYSYVAGGFALAPQGGLSEDVEFILNDQGVWQRSFFDYSTDRPADQYQVDGSYFFNTGDLSHEMRFGGSYRNFEVLSVTRIPGNSYAVRGENFGITSDLLGAGIPTDVIVFHRPGITNFEADYYGVWLQDTITAGKLTANLGLRYDIQSGANLEANIPGNPDVPDLLPSLNFTGNEPEFEWETISPRLGLTYAVGDERKTLLRASYARFAQQLATGYISVLNPLGAGYAYHFWADTNDDGFYQQGEPTAFWSSFGTFNPNDPTALTTVSRLDPNLEPSLTDELILGVDHAFLPEFVVGANFTYRKISDIIEGRTQVFDENGDVVIATRDDYLLNQEATDQVGRPVYDLRGDWSTGAGSYFTNGDAEQDYLGASVNFTKRLANRWMARGHFTWYEWEWDVPESSLRFQNPTNQVGGGDADGEIVAEQSGGSGSKGGIWLNSTWSANLNGLYQVAPDRPWGFNVAANLNAREGFINPRFTAVNLPTLGSVNVEDGEFGDNRNENVYTLDLRLDKDFQFGDWGFTVSADVFNVFNEAFVLQRQRNLSLSTANNVQETLSPRIIRLGVQLNFR